MYFNQKVREHQNKEESLQMTELLPHPDYLDHQAIQRDNDATVQS